jgi:hypothetical protein
MDDGRTPARVRRVALKRQRRFLVEGTRKPAGLVEIQSTNFAISGSQIHFRALGGHAGEGHVSLRPLTPGDIGIRKILPS